MKTGTILLLVGIGAAVYYFTQFGVAANTLQYVLQGVDFSNLSSWQVTILVQNVGNTSLTVNSMSGTVTLNGTTVGNISNFSGPITIPANGQQAIKVIVNPSLIGAGSVIFTMIQNNSGLNNLTFVIAGNVNVNSIIEPFTITNNISI